MRQTRPHYNSSNVGPPGERKRCRTCTAINADPQSPRTPINPPHQSDLQEGATACGPKASSGPMSHVERVGLDACPSGAGEYKNGHALACCG